MLKRYVLIGASIRGLYAYVKPILENFSDRIEIVGIFDVNILRAEALKEIAGLDCPTYDDCEKLLAELSPDRAIIATIDRYHHESYVSKLEN